jgi:hypothetical protein
VDRESKQKERETAVPSAEPLLLLLNEWLFCAPTDELLSAAPKTWVLRWKSDDLCYFFLMNSYSVPLLKTCQWTENQSKRKRERDCCTKCSSENVSTEKNKRRPLLLLFNKWLFCSLAEKLPVDRESKQETKAERKRLLLSAAPKVWVLKWKSDDLCHFFLMNSYSVPLLKTCQCTENLSREKERLL